MKTALFVCATLVSTALTNPVIAQEALATERDKISYMLGMNIGNSIKAYAAELDVDMLTLAIRHVLSEEKLLLSAEEAAALQQAFMETARARQEQLKQQAAGDNLKQGEAFLAENAKKDGVSTTQSGLQYQVLQAGSGAKPKATDTVTVHYRGTLIDGTEFDSSYGRGEPTTFALNRVIPGWTEGVQLMSVGGKYKFFIPSTLAYGERGAGQSIGPNSALIFEVELLEIK